MRPIARTARRIAALALVAAALPAASASAAGASVELEQQPRETTILVAILLPASRIAAAPETTQADFYLKIDSVEGESRG